MTTPPKPSPEAVAAACEIDTKCAHVGYFGDAYIHLDRAERIIDRHFAPIIAKAELCDRLAIELQAIADEAVCHHEHNPISGKDRLPRGFTTILNMASDALDAYSALATRAAGPAVVGGGRE